MKWSTNYTLTNYFLDMDALFNQRKREEQQLLKLSRKKVNNSTIAIEKTMHRLIKREPISGQKFDGL